MGAADSLFFFYIKGQPPAGVTVKLSLAERTLDWTLSSSRGEPAHGAPLVRSHRGWK